MFDVVSLSLRYQSGDWERVIEKTNHRVAEVEPLVCIPSLETGNESLLISITNFLILNL
jgi:hypothetical protein